MDRLRLVIAPIALLVPSIAFALNAFISFRERRIVEPYDVSAALGLFVAALLAWRRSLAALVGGAVLCAIYLASVVQSGPMVFIAYWIVALALTLQALPLARRGRATA